MHDTNNILISDKNLLCNGGIMKYKLRVKIIIIFYDIYFTIIRITTVRKINDLKFLKENFLLHTCI